MKRNNTTNEQNAKGLVIEYEAMSQKGTVGFYEKAVFLQLIDHYLGEQLFDHALEVIEHAVSQHPFSGTFHIVQAQLYIEKNCESLALESLDKAILYAPSVFEVQILRAEALSSLGVFNEAFEILADLLPNADPEQRSEIYLSKALIFESTKRYKNMFLALKKAVLANPENTDALERIWFSVEMTQQYDESIKLHKELIDIDPYSFTAWYNLGYAFSAKNDHKNARDAFEYAFIINDKFEFAYRECAASCIHLKEYNQALKYYAELQEHFDADADLFVKIGLCHEALGNIEKAKAFFLKARALDENNDEVYFHLGNCFLEETNFESAKAAFEKAIIIDTLKEEYYLALADVYYQNNELDLAQSFFQKAADIAPDSTKCWILYARFLIQTGKKEMALDVLDEAELYAFGVELKYCRIACLFSLNKRQEALFLFKNALQENYKKHDSLFEISPALKGDEDIQTLISVFF
jgi:tetratricopeptide (TPR) repeat protein